MADRRAPTDDAFIDNGPAFDANGVCIAISLRQGDTTTTTWRTVAEAEALVALITEAVAKVRTTQLAASRTAWALSLYQQAAE